MRKKLERCATNKVYYHEGGIKKTATTKEDIERACIIENVARFTQANNTPPMVEPLRSELGTRNSKKKDTENIYMEIHTLGTRKEMRVTRKRQ